MIIGLIREEKQPADKRVAFSPEHCKQILQQYPGSSILVQPSDNRSFSNQEFKTAGCIINEDLSTCDFLFGIKEVPPAFLIPEKTYLYFSHTIKKQPYNKQMLQTILKQHNTLIDYECLLWPNGSRIIGFGRFAGIVGMHNGLLTYGRKMGLFNLKPAHECFDYKEMISQYNAVRLPSIKIALLGDGRVAHGALEVLNKLKIREVTARAFLHESFNEPVYVHLRIDQLYEHQNNSPFDKSYFYHNPSEYFSVFNQYYQVTDLMINAIYWEEGIPRHFSLNDMARPEFRIKVIADISCDVNGSVPATIRDTTIQNPVYGWDTTRQMEVEPYLPNTVDIMAVGNLPCELSRDASVEFGQLALKYVLPALLIEDKDQVILHATIASEGKLMPRFQYLSDYVIA